MVQGATRDSSRKARGLPSCVCKPSRFGNTGGSNGVFVKRIQKSSKKSLFQKSVVSPQNTALFNPLSTTAFQQNHIMLEETTNSTKNVVVNAYEAARDLRVRQNIERMKSIGIEAAKTKVDAIVANVAKKTKSASSSASHLSKKRVKKRSEISPSNDGRRRVRGEKAPDIHAIKTMLIQNNLLNRCITKICKSTCETQRSTLGMGTVRVRLRQPSRRL